MIRSGNFIISKGYAEVNNKFLKSYDSNKPTSYIVYLDTNNLYVQYMMQLFPFEILDWVHPEKNILDIYGGDSLIDCFLEVGLNYCDEVYDLHNDYPLAVGKVKVTKEMLPDYQLQITEDKNIFLGKNKKLIPNIDNKRKYKLHYQYLKLYLEICLQLKKFTEH